jgi:phosphoglycolate phosphatase
MFANVKNIIFDLDGTLIDSSAGVIEATNYALTSHGQAPRSAKEIKRFIGHPIEEMFAVFCDAPLDSLKAAFQERARHSVVTSARPLDGVNHLLPLIQGKGYRLAIATTKFAIHTEGIVKKLGWNEYFYALASGDEVARVKPAPDIIVLALTRLGGTPADTIMIGDTSIDIQAAHAAGLKVIVIKSPFGNNEIDSFGPEMKLDRFDDLRQVLNI